MRCILSVLVPCRKNATSSDDECTRAGGVWVPEQTCWKFEDASVESVTAAVRECTDEEFVIKTDAGGSTLTPHPPAKRTASSSKKPSEFALADMTLAEKKQMDAQRKWKRVKISEDGDEIL